MKLKMSYSKIILEQKGQIAKITLNRPEEDKSTAEKEVV